ncbi:MAG: hypothetical protein M3Q48_09945 [Actinomycetota bacterium]|nr:hypothetical protein [Actinomycetota bacterium]
MTSAFVVGAAVLTMSSAAFACTVFRGEMTIKENDGHSRSGLPLTVTANQSRTVGNNANMGYCKLEPGATGFSGAEVTIEVKAAPSGCPSSTFTPNTNYDVNYVNGRAFYDPISPAFPYGWQIDCMSPRDLGVVALGSQVAANASGEVPAFTRTLPTSSANASGEDSAICLSTTGGGNGNQAPIQIVAV